MPNASISAAVATARHPQEAARLMQELGIADPAAAKWCYSMAMRLDGSARANHDKGIGAFLRNPEPYYIALEAAVNRKKRALALDNATLAAGPRQNLPLELFEGVDRPEGVSAYAWQPTRVESPGWNELVITAAVQSGQQVLLRGTLDNGAERLFHLCAGQWKEVQAHRAVELFGKPLAAKTRAWLCKGTAFPQEVGVEDLSFDQIEQLVSAQSHRKLPAAPASAAELLSALGFGGEEAHMLAPDQPQPPLSQQGGRVYAWGEQVSDDDIADYARLVSSDSSPAFGNVFEVLMGATNPLNQGLKELAAGVLERLAWGDAREAALATALSAFASTRNLPAPLPGADPVAYLTQHLASASPLGIQPVMLNRHR